MWKGLGGCGICGLNTCRVCDACKGGELHLSLSQSKPCIEPFPGIVDKVTKCYMSKQVQQKYQEDYIKYLTTYITESNILKSNCLLQHRIRISRASSTRSM